MIKISLWRRHSNASIASLLLLSDQIATAAVTEVPASKQTYKIAAPVALNPSPMEMHPNDDWRKKNKRKFR